MVGAAYFDVPHRDDRTLTITAGEYSVRDIGTRFEVSTQPQGTRIAVADGILTVSSDRLTTPVALRAGQALVAAGRTTALSRSDPAAVGSWRRGQLVYDRVPLALVAADLGRYGGRQVTVDPRIADLRFSGALAIGDGTKLANSVAAILGIAARSDGVGLRLEPRR